MGQEREALKAQERAAAEAEEARRRRVVVTLDLLGRQVLCKPQPPLHPRALQFWYPEAYARVTLHLRVMLSWAGA